MAEGDVFECHTDKSWDVIVKIVNLTDFGTT